MAVNLKEMNPTLAYHDALTGYLLYCILCNVQLGVFQPAKPVNKAVQVVLGSTTSPIFVL